MSRLLENDELQRQLEQLPGWSGDTNGIERVAELPTFPSAIKVVDAVAVDAEAMNHHPDIDIRWRTLTLRLTTHDAGGVTQLDIELAHQIERAIANVTR